MSVAWLHFSIVIFVQFLVFIICAYHLKKVSQVPHILIKGIMIGIIFGLPFDLILGEFLNFHSYILGFSISFLVLNTAISYGLFAANILLLEQMKFSYFCIWTICIMVVYEITNLFFPVWNWEIILPPIQFLLMLSAGYLGGAILVIRIFNTTKYLKRLF